MTIEITLNKLQDSIYVIPLKGAMDAESCEGLDVRLKESLAIDSLGVILDMSGVDYLSSMGMRTIFCFKKELQNRNIVFAMANLKPKVYEIFDIMKTVPALNIYDDIEESERHVIRMLSQEASLQK